MSRKEFQIPSSAVQLRRMAKLIGAMFITCLASVAPQLVQAQAPRSPTPESVKGVVDFQTIAKGLEHPWSLAFLPDGRMLVTERPGRLRVVSSDGARLRAGHRSPAGLCERSRRAAGRGAKSGIR